MAVSHQWKWTLKRLFLPAVVRESFASMGCLCLSAKSSMKNLEKGSLLAFIFEILGSNRTWFKDYITLCLPSINHQFRASDLQGKFCLLINKIWFIFIPFHIFALKLKNPFPIVTIGRLIYCRLLSKDLLCTGRWVVASLYKEDSSLPARGGGKSTSGQIKGEESTKWKEVWAVSV